MKILKILFILFLISDVSYSQNNLKDAYTTFDKVIGLKNTNLSYGILFKENYRTLKGNHHYYKSDQFKNGDVHYNNETFYNVPLKYDLDSDNLIVNIKGEFETFSIILEKSSVNNFSIENNQFINIKGYGYSEILFSSEIVSLYKKNKKNKKKKVDKSFLYYKFISDYSHIIQFKNNYYIVKKAKDFIKIFPNQKKFIYKYFKTNKKIRKRDFDVFLIQLTKQLSTKI